ncbi:MAG: DUF4339 domain-containing protein, partial [Verrucomicrobiota bacterium]
LKFTKMNHWYYAVAGEVNGPVGTRQLVELIRQNSLPAETPVWAQGMSGWLPADEAAEENGWELGEEAVTEAS